MSATVLMKVLESAPRRYERGMRLLSLGQVDRAYDRLSAHVESGQHVLDLGCGTGMLTLRAAQRGAYVRGIDVHAGMLAEARRKAELSGLTERIELVEVGVAELDREPEGSVQVVMGGLCFSELTAAERAYTLAHVRRLLEPGGLLLLADEVVPKGPLRRIVHTTIRVPLAVLAWLLTQTTSHAVPALREEVEQAGFTIESRRLNWLHSFLEIVARKPGCARSGSVARP